MNIIYVNSHLAQIRANPVGLNYRIWRTPLQGQANLAVNYYLISLYNGKLASYCGI